jgi:preprotein translocase subunit SecB
MNNIDVQNAIRLIKVQFPKFNITSSDSMNDDNLTDELDMKIGYSIMFSETDTNRFVIKFKVKLLNKEGNFDARFTMIALFEAETEVDETFKNSLLVKINAPAIAFPFLRSFIMTMSVNAGFKPIIIPSINLTKNE